MGFLFEGQMRLKWILKEGLKLEKKNRKENRTEWQMMKKAFCLLFPRFNKLA